jgi:hypothetical protein
LLKTRLENGKSKNFSKWELDIRNTGCFNWTLRVWIKIRDIVTICHGAVFRNRAKCLLSI